MATSIFGLLLSNSSDANFRAWGSALSTQIGSVLTRVVQSGDINWSTVTAPAAINTNQGSEVFRFNDTLQSTQPLFLKVEYGSGSGSSTAVGLRLTVGKSTDGSGNIGDQLLAATQVVQCGSTATVINNCYISGGSSWFALSLDPLSSGQGGLFYIERSIGVGGVPTGNAVLIGWQIRTGQAQAHRFIDYAALTTETVAGGIIAMPLSLASDRSIANGTVAPIFPAACISPAGNYWRPRVILGTARQNAGLGEVINGLLDGNTYLSLGIGAQKSDHRGGDYATTLIRWN